MALAQTENLLDTSKVAGRREVRYANLDELLADVEQLHAGGCRYLGNWSLGRITQHLAYAMNAALDGAPSMAPWPVRLVASWLYKKKAVSRPMRPGFKLPDNAAKHMVPEECGAEQGIEALRETIARWKSEPQRHPHAFFGKLTNDQWDQLSLRHAEMHMSFVVPSH